LLRADKIITDTLEIKFQEAYTHASSIPQEDLPQDMLLKLYALAKQATHGDNDSEPKDSEELDVRNGFKLNAWIQLRGMTCNEAKKKYISLVKTL